MPAKPNERLYRMLSVPLTTRIGTGEQEPEREKRFDTDYYVEGYATTFNDPYVLWHDPWAERDYMEVIAPDAFRNADMSDVIMQYNHEGHVYARLSNNTLIIEPDEHGLFVAADLSKSSASRAMYEEIESGLCTRMSWAFTVAEDAYDRETHTTTILKVKKVFDVSAVSFPADPNTEISARAFNGEIGRAYGEYMRHKARLASSRARASAAIAIAKARKKV